MQNFSTEKYSNIVTEIRDRIQSAGVFSEQNSAIFIETTSLQIRKILELIAYLSVLVNQDKLNHKDRGEWHAKKIIENLSNKTTVFYPLPSHIIYSQDNASQPVLIPQSYENSLSQSDFIKVYKRCGEVLHAQHPLKEILDIEIIFSENKDTLQRLRNLLQNHTIGIKHESNKYTFLSVAIDFTNDEKTKPSYIKEIKANIYNEQELISIFSGNYA
ncbi:hypothetical protein PTRA_b0347 [Pseudoalteromonas translucida KMM 520]|uniref:Uncharacterized protein n=1 Tax=Pseudoalteromonas translucida KMM 520 TaxID=1315283 RepID=A0A0U2WNB4_9GAMM|nr:hypothetical protein [Pseudoalteromonas translucida]ALS34842.1 hypothetical protein PTRA_b0347 [Pseudoalteromonas translucida KMM 520]